jgi:glycosyltransferase involved in cell wall biosynthesis
MSPIKVLYMLHDSRRSGVPAVAAAFIRRAAEAGVAPTVLFAHDGVYAEELKQTGIPVVTLGARTPLVWRCKRFLLNRFLFARGKAFDVIHIHSRTLAWSVLVARWLGLKAVFHLHELQRPVSRLVRTAMAVADCVVFCSETCAAHYTDVPAKAKRTIVNAMAFSDRPPVDHSNGKLRIVMAASLNRNKGQDILLNAFARLRNREAELWLYGTTGLSARGYVRALKRYAADQGIADRVFFPGPTDNALSVFAEASVVVHTSWTESFGMALVEAQSCGVPVIAHDLEGMREVVADGVTGYLIPPGDVPFLAKRLDALLADNELRKRLGGAGYRIMRERFDIEMRMDDYRHLYEELCRG